MWNYPPGHGNLHLGTWIMTNLNEYLLVIKHFSGHFMGNPSVTKCFWKLQQGTARIAGA